MKPRVSVVTIFYNADEFLGEAVESVLAQDTGDFELLLVDDGSTDGSAKIAKRYAQARPEQVRYLQHDGGINRGMSVSRNLGIDRSASEFIAFIDADDRWEPNKLREQLCVLDRNPNADAVCGSVRYWRSWPGGDDRIVPTGHVADKLVSPPEAAVWWYPLGKAHAPSMSDLLMRTVKVRAVGGFEPSFTGAYEDQAFLTKFYLQNSIFVANSLWSNYRLHEQSCMAATIRNGGYQTIRRNYLNWLQAYLQTHPELADARVIAAMRRAMFENRHPTVARSLRLLSTVQRRLGTA